MSNARRVSSELSGRRAPRPAVIRSRAGKAADSKGVEEQTLGTALVSAIAAARGDDTKPEPPLLTAPSAFFDVFATATRTIVDADTADVVASLQERVRLLYPMSEGDDGRIYMTLRRAHLAIQFSDHRVAVYGFDGSQGCAPFRTFQRWRRRTKARRFFGAVCHTPGRRRLRTADQFHLKGSSRESNLRWFSESDA